MAISHLKIKSLRNHKEKSFSFNKGLTVIFGENGSGKTSILEAIHVLSIGKSFKTKKQKELIKKGKNELVLNGVFIKNKIKTNVSTSIHKNLNQKIKINGKNILNRKELFGKNNVVLLSPEEQKITIGPAKERRLFFDKLFSTTSKSFLRKLLEYNKTLKQRNAILKTDDNLKNKLKNIEPWNNLIVEKGLNLWKQKKTNFNLFQNLFIKTTLEYDQKIKISLKYNNKNLNKDFYYQELEKNQERDFFLKRTTFGPHLDDFNLYWNNKTIRNYGSQGEHKTLLVLLKLTELKYIKKTTNEEPILLFDDLFATIDLERSKKIIKALKKIEKTEKKQIQTIITTTDIFNINKTGFDFKNIEKQTYELKR